MLLENFTRELFERGTLYAKSKNLILVDTKYEFGKLNEIYLVDETHTLPVSIFLFRHISRTSKSE